MTPPALTRSEVMIRDAEASRVQVNGTPGKNRTGEAVPLSFLHSAYIDEEYLVMGSHLEEALIKKIKNHEFVDFGKLLPRDKINVEEDNQRMELINQNGMTYWSPVSHRESTNSINSFSKWETTFRVFSNVYTTEYPFKVAELLQYAHVIYTASQTYYWDNVYLYDKEFRFHMSKHPQRSWSLILQQAWNLRLKDKIKHDNFSGDHHGRNQKSKEICKRFNRGKCNLESACKYDHRCLECGKFGHGMHICRKKNKGDKPESQEKARSNNHQGTSPTPTCSN